jgi:3-oxoacyl-[acyl-carrier-protein] synthase III
MSVSFASVASYVPPKVVTNDDLAAKLDTSDEWIHSHTGIRKRHIVEDGQGTVDIAAEAAKSALAKAGLEGKDIDLIIVGTSTPDYLAFPSTACSVQNRIGAIGSAAFDVSAACTGFIYSCVLAASMIETGRASKALVIGADTLSRITDWNDRGSAILFGDGAGAAVLTKGEAGFGLLDSILGADGSGERSLFRPADGSYGRYGKEPHANSGPMYLGMNGREVYNFAVRVNVEMLETFAARNSLASGDVDYIVPHQANRRIIEAASSRSGIPMERFYVNIDEYANTSAASIPIALTEMEAKGVLKRGMRLILMGFGAGLTYGGIYARW